MHSYLFVGSNSNNLETEIKNFAKKINRKIVEYEIDTIDKVRELKHQVNLSHNEDYAFYLPNINNSTESAQNALLKTLEEPNNKVIFLISAESENGILETILSRCEIIRLPFNVDEKSIETYKEYVALNTGEKFMFLSKLSDREKTISFLKDYIAGATMELVENNKLSTMAEVATEVLKRIEGNANVQTQLTYFISKDLSTALD